MYAESEEAKMKKITACLCIMAVTMFFAFFLFYPWSKKVYEDGGTTIYSSLSYKILIWKGRDERNRFEFYPFPENLKNSLELLADP